MNKIHNPFINQWTTSSFFRVFKDLYPKKKKRVFKDCSGKEKEIIIADAVTLEADINSEKNFPPKQDSNLLTGIAPQYIFFFP